MSNKKSLTYLVSCFAVMMTLYIVFFMLRVPPDGLFSKIDHCERVVGVPSVALETIGENSFKTCTSSRLKSGFVNLQDINCHAPKHAFYVQKKQHTK